MSLYNDAEAIWRFNNNPDDAKGNHNLVNTGSTYDGTIKRYGPYSAFMDGFNDFFAAADDPAFKQNEFSWVIPIYIASFGVWNGAITKHNPATASGWSIFVAPDNIAYFQAGNGSAWAIYNANYDVSGTGLGWHILGGTHSLVSHKMYWDDKLVSSGAGGALGHNTKDVWFGRNADGEGYLRGQIDETPYFTRQLTDGGVSQGQVAGGEWAELYANFLIGKELEPVAGDGGVSGFFGLGKMGIR